MIVEINKQTIKELFTDELMYDNILSAFIGALYAPYEHNWTVVSKNNFNKYVIFYANKPLPRKINNKQQTPIINIKPINFKKGVYNIIINKP